MVNSSDVSSASAIDTTAAIVLDELRVETATGIPIVDGVSLRLDRGDILGVVGESGSGKTTTALSLFGFAQGGARLAKGTVTLPGHPPFDLTNTRSLAALRGRYLSYVPQSPGTSLNPSMRIGRALREMQSHRDANGDNGSKDLAAERAEVLKIVGLGTSEEFQRRFPHQLSGGQQQRVCLAIALLSGAQTIVLDEPTTGLDVITQGAVLEELRRLRRDLSVAMVYISHDLAVVAQLATHVAVMYAGKIIEFGTVDQVINRPAHPYSRGLLQSTPDHRAATLVQAMPGVSISLTERDDRSCSFSPRCPHATDVCRAEEPPLAAIDASERLVSCFHPLTSDVSVVHDTEVEADRDSSKEILTVDKLSIEYRVRGVPVAAVADVSFTLNQGECVALVGESGSGKTTIARTIAGIQSYHSGSINLLGQQLAPVAQKRTVEQRRLIQIVFQNATAALNPRQTVRTAIERALRLCPKSNRRTVEELMELVRLQPSLADRLPRQLSGGERQRVAIARGLATNPEILVCDEITSALDVSVQAAVLSLLRDLRERLGLSMLFITHDLGVVANLADRVLVLQGGRICEAGATRAVLDNPESDYAQRLMSAVPSVTASV